MRVAVPFNICYQLGKFEYFLLSTDISFAKLLTFFKDNLSRMQCQTIWLHISDRLTWFGLGQNYLQLLPADNKSRI